MIEGSCHCGKVTFRVSQPPERLVDCNCSICLRIGALWGHVPIGSVDVQRTGETAPYVQGDKTLAMHTCTTCGCTTHWENLQPEDNAKMAVNFRMCGAEEISRHQIRKFDGAETWTFLD